MANPNVIAKAIIGSVIAGAGEVNLALADNVITGAEWAKIVGVIITVFAAIWAVPNATPTPVSNSPLEKG